MRYDANAAEQMRIASNVISIKDAARLSLRTTDANTYIAAPSANVIGFYTGDTQRVNINSGGTVTIDQDSNAHALAIDSEATSGQCISIDGTQTTGSGIMMDMNSLTTGGCADQVSCLPDH